MPGRVARTFSPSWAPIFVSTTGDAYNEFIRLVIARDLADVYQMRDAGLLFELPSGIRVEVTDVHGGSAGIRCSIRIIEGGHAGEDGLVPPMFLQ
jgi:hypothetical protein